MKPRRIQRSRAKGSRLPPGAVCVTRGTRWGNPIRLDSYTFAHADGTPAPYNDEEARDLCLRDYEAHLRMGTLPYTVEDVRRELRGKVLACWCRPDQRCHGDVLLEVANE